MCIFGDTIRRADKFLFPFFFSTIVKNFSPSSRIVLLGVRGAIWNSVFEKSRNERSLHDAFQFYATISSMGRGVRWKMICMEKVEAKI